MRNFVREAPGCNPIEMIRLVDERIESPSYWYIGSPYSRYAEGLEPAFVAACRIMGRLIKAGVPVFSPIAHTHYISIHGGMDPLDHSIWMPADEPMMRAAHGLIVVKLPGWDSSYGLSIEIEAFGKAQKPVLYLDPEELEK